jgi:hypothetical protein
MLAHVLRWTFRNLLGSVYIVGYYGWVSYSRTPKNFRMSNAIVYT